MKKIQTLSAFLFFVTIFLINKNFDKNYLNNYQKAPEKVSAIEIDYETNFIKSYESKNSEPFLDSLQCPIPYEDRVKNHTGIQCVYSSIEMLGRWAEEPKLIDPPITSRDDCKSYSSPEKAKKILNKINVKFEQVYGDKEEGIKLIKKAMNEGRGALWSVPGHAMVLVHYSEEQDRVCWVDNSDRQLRVQETTINGFKKRWTSWVLVIYPEDDSPLLIKLNKINFKIIDHDNKKNKLEYFIPFPIQKL